MTKTLFLAIKTALIVAGSRLALPALSDLTAGQALVVGLVVGGAAWAVGHNVVEPELGPGGAILTDLFMSGIIVYAAGIIVLRPQASPPLTAAVAYALGVAGLEAAFWLILSRLDGGALGGEDAP